jgi:hypothetical protein
VGRSAGFASGGDILLLNRHRAADVRALQGNEGPEGYLMAPSKHIYLVVDAGNPVAAFTAKHEMNTYLKRRLGTFKNPLVYTFGGDQGYFPAIMTMSSAMADG